VIFSVTQRRGAVLGRRLRHHARAAEKANRRGSSACTVRYRARGLSPGFGRAETESRCSH
jgi:hypothetical protein